MLRYAVPTYTNHTRITLLAGLLWEAGVSTRFSLFGRMRNMPEVSGTLNTLRAKEFRRRLRAYFRGDYGRQQGMRTTFNSYHRYACSLFLTAALAHRASSTLAGPLLATRMSVCICCASSFFWFGRLWAPSRRTTHSVALHLSAIIQEHYHKGQPGSHERGQVQGILCATIILPCLPSFSAPPRWPETRPWPSHLPMPKGHNTWGRGEALILVSGWAELGWAGWVGGRCWIGP